MSTTNAKITLVFERDNQNKVKFKATKDNVPKPGSERFKSKRTRVNYLEVHGTDISDPPNVRLSRPGTEFFKVDQKLEKDPNTGNVTKVKYWFWCRETSDDGTPAAWTNTLTVVVDTTQGPAQEQEPNVEVESDP